MASTLSLFPTNGVVTSAPTPSVPLTVESASSSGAYVAPFSGLKGKSSLSSNVSRGGQFLPSRSLRFRSYKQRGCPVIVMGAEEATIPSLNDLPLIQYINQQGRIQPSVENTTKASVFAIFDENKKIQYIGFSKDVRNSLRTLMGRRPTLCCYYRLYNLDSLDQQKMLSCRQQWVSELGLPPVGNADPVQKVLWEQSADAGSISERGREAAATSMAKSFLQTMADRGLKEEMVYDPELLAAGKCDVLPSVDQSAEEMAAAARVQAEEAASRRAVVVTSPRGDKIEFDVFFEFKYPTNGGWMYDILVYKDDKETRHRVTCGRIYPESVNIPEDRFIEIIMGFLLHKRVPRRTEGLMTGDIFPINYFAVSEVSQQFDELKDWFAGELPETYWRFNKIYSFGELTIAGHFILAVGALVFVDSCVPRITRSIHAPYFLTIPFLLSAAVTAVAGCICVPLLKKVKVAQIIRKEGPVAHLVKSGTPTMGGLYFVPVGLAVAALFNRSASVEVHGVIGMTLVYSSIGLLDDGLSLLRKHNYGLPGRIKLMLQVVAGILFYLWLKSANVSSSYIINSILPLPAPLGRLHLGEWYMVLTAFCCAAMGNGVNLTDGLDGLAGGTAAAALIAMAVVMLPSNPALGVFGSSMAGACFGFLVHNRYKAKVFMGDTGSLALGGALAAMAACSGMFFPLLIASGVFVVETVSVLGQVFYFQLTKRLYGQGRRWLRMAPFHHHLEFLGFSETRITALAYAAGVILSLLAVYTGLMLS